MFRYGEVRVPSVPLVVLAVFLPFAAAGLTAFLGRSLVNVVAKDKTVVEKKKHIITHLTNVLVVVIAILILLFISLPLFGITPLGDPFKLV